MAMISLNNILRKCIRGYKFTKLQEKFNNLMYIDSMKLFQKMKKNGLFGLVWFYGISTIVGYLMLNLVYTYMSNINDL